MYMLPNLGPTFLSLLHTVQEMPFVRHALIECLFLSLVNKIKRTKQLKRSTFSIKNIELTGTMSEKACDLCKNAKTTLSLFTELSETKQFLTNLFFCSQTIVFCVSSAFIVLRIRLYVIHGGFEYNILHRLRFGTERERERVTTCMTIQEVLETREMETRQKRVRGTHGLVAEVEGMHVLHFETGFVFSRSFTAGQIWKSQILVHCWLPLRGNLDSLKFSNNLGKCTWRLTRSILPH